MRVMLDFRCKSCAHECEAYVDSLTTATECPECGGTMDKQISMPTVRLEGVSGAFPGAHAKWARIREDNARIKAARA